MNEVTEEQALDLFKRSASWLLTHYGPTDSAAMSLSDIIFNTLGELEAFFKQREKPADG